MGVGMGHHAQFSAAFGLLPKQLAHTLIGFRHMVLNICVPISLLMLYLLVAHADDIAEQRHDAGVKVIGKVLCESAVYMRMVFGHVFNKAGEMNRRGAVDHRVIVVDHQTGKSHIRLQRILYSVDYTVICFFSQSEKNAEEIPLRFFVLILIRRWGSRRSSLPGNESQGLSSSR